jgi:hypothetical protein
MKKQLNKKQKQADHDLNVILILTLVPLLLFLTLKPTLLSYTNQTSVPLWLRLILLASCQFAIAGLGTSTVMLYRKESFRHFGLITKNLVTTLFQSLLVALPLIIFKGLTHQIHSYLPLQSIQLTKEVMSQSFPSNILAYLFICLIWGFWEGFNYVVIAEKIRIRFPSPYSWLDSGAITCAIFCLLIHGIIGFDIYTLFESITVFILIYGMLAIQKHNKTPGVVSCSFYLFGMPSSLFINHNTTEIITANLYGCFIILRNKKKSRSSSFYTIELFSDFREVFKSTYKL